MSCLMLEPRQTSPYQHDSQPASIAACSYEETLLKDVEGQFDRFHTLFKELCSHLACNHEVLAQNHHPRAARQTSEFAACTAEEKLLSSSCKIRGPEIDQCGKMNVILSKERPEPAFADTPIESPDKEYEEQEASRTARGWASSSINPSFASEKSDMKLASASLQKAVRTTLAFSKENGVWTRGSLKSVASEYEVDLTWLGILKLGDEMSKENAQYQSELLYEECAGPKLSDGSFAVEDYDMMNEHSSWFPRWPSGQCALVPNHPIRLTWDLLGIAAMLHDLVWIPLLMCGASDSSASSVLSWILRIYWTLDIPATFTVGYVDIDGEIVMESKRVAARYCRSWLFFDLSLVIADWVEMVLTHALDLLRTARFSKVLRTLRVVRMIRLARLVKLPIILNKMLEHIFAERTMMVMSITKITLLFLAFCHIIACIWFKLASDNYDDDNWLEGHGYGAEITEYTYAVSLHWAVTCFIGTMEVQAYNLWERVFSIVVLIVSFVASASFVSAITTSITRLQLINSKAQTNFSTLRMYLRVHRVNKKLAQRITKAAKYALKSQKNKVSETDVELLNFISSPLKVEMHFDIYSRVLSIHMLFKFYCSLNPVAMRRVCHEAISTIMVTSKEVVFRKGLRPDPPCMLFLTHGGLAYTKTDRSDRVHLDASTFVCEATLWLSNWIHKGTLAGSTESTVLRLHAEQFQEIMGEEFDPSNEDHPAWYSMMFLNQLATRPPHLITDLHVEFDDASVDERNRAFEKINSKGESAPTTSYALGLSVLHPSRMTEGSAFSLNLRKLHQSVLSPSGTQRASQDREAVQSRYRTSTSKSTESF